MSPQKTVVNATVKSTLVSDSAVEWLEYRLVIEVKTIQGSAGPFPIVGIGGFDWYPSREQMVELRDKLSAYLEANPAPTIEPAPEPVAPVTHERDSDCTVDPETELFTVCGVDHSSKCPDCGGRGVHSDGCWLSAPKNEEPF